MTSNNYYGACYPKASIQPQNHHRKHSNNQDSKTKTNKGSHRSSKHLDHKEKRARMKTSPRH
jgi:hypothetical protein